MVPTVTVVTQTIPSSRSPKDEWEHGSAQASGVFSIRRLHMSGLHADEVDRTARVKDDTGLAADKITVAEKVYCESAARCREEHQW